MPQLEDKFLNIFVMLISAMEIRSSLFHLLITISGNTGVLKTVASWCREDHHSICDEIRVFSNGRSMPQKYGPMWLRPTRNICGIFFFNGIKDNSHFPEIIKSWRWQLAIRIFLGNQHQPKNAGEAVHGSKSA